MSKVETALSLDQILEGMRQLSAEEKRTLAAIVLSDPELEDFVEEFDDHLTCERKANEGPPEPFNPAEVTSNELACTSHSHLTSVR